jgi:DNA-binding FrmR family transcriptional regulator
MVCQAPASLADSPADPRGELALDQRRRAPLAFEYPVGYNRRNRTFPGIGSSMSVIRDERHKKDLLLRLRRVEGQLRGIQGMIESGAECEQVTQQLSAARRALDKAFFNVLACAIQATPEKAAPAKASVEERVKQAAALLAKFG